jgi:Cu-processing system permease protein
MAIRIKGMVPAGAGPERDLLAVDDAGAQWSGGMGLGARIRPVLVIVGHEFRSALRGKMVPAFAALFALLAIGIALAGLGASGRLIVQGFTRTTVSLLTLALYLLPLLGALLGASAFGGEDGSTELLLAQPIGRAEALIGRLGGLYAALIGISLAGFGAAGVLVAATAGGKGIGGFALVALGATAVGGAGLGVGVLIGIMARSRSTAVGWALGAWFTAAILYDIGAITLLQLTGTGEPGPWLIGILALNPIDGIRALSLISLGADVLLGPTGAALQRLLGAGGGAIYVLASLAIWVAAPPALAAWVFGRRDF